MSATFSAIERSHGRPLELTPDGEASVGGRSMRRARPVGPDRRFDLAVEHPKHGWTCTNAACLAIVDRKIGALPAETAGRPVRYRVDGGPNFLGHLATAWDAALYAAFLEDGGLESVPVTWAEGIALLHRWRTFGDAGYAVWSDGQVTEDRGMPAVDVPSALEPGARELIHLARLGHSRRAAVGYATLLRVAEIRSREEIAVGPEGEFQRDRLQRLRVLMVDGEERDLWVRTCGDRFGYRCAIHGAHPDEWVVGRDGVLIDNDWW